MPKHEATNGAFKPQLALDVLLLFVFVFVFALALVLVLAELLT